jgi:hypothetical protein
MNGFQFGEATALLKKADHNKLMVHTLDGEIELWDNKSVVFRSSNTEDLISFLHGWEAAKKKYGPDSHLSVEGNKNDNRHN